VIKEFGDNHDQVALFINRLQTLTHKDMETIQLMRELTLNNSAWDAAWKSAQTLGLRHNHAAWKSAWMSARKDTKDATLYTARTSSVLVVRNLISVEDFEILISPCRFLLEELRIVEPLKE
jgi:CelD/BcsL family acetyltransferase involved in cellulose biosynthesis